MATTVSREQKVAGHAVLEHSGPGGHRKLVYVNNQMVTTQWDETVAILERGEMPEIEGNASAMSRVMACF